MFFFCFVVVFFFSEPPFSFSNGPCAGDPLHRALVEPQTKAPDDGAHEEIPERVAHSGVRVKAVEVQGLRSKSIDI